jgi:RNA polymerase sigma-70 factor (ECF subfamily)
MIGAMAKIIEQTNNDDLVVKARTDADALGQLYDLYYEQIFRFCVHRLFDKETAEDVTSTVFLEVARRIRTFAGRSEQDFRNWLYAIAVNQTNAYVRKTSRRRKLLKEVTASLGVSDTDSTDHLAKPDWLMIYQAILKLKPKHQTIVTLRFFENMEFDQIGRIINAKPATVRVTLHRILRKLRRLLTK